jgi:hypothetical protein
MKYIVILNVVDMAMKNGFIHSPVFVAILLITLLFILILK